MKARARLAARGLALARVPNPDAGQPGEPQTTATVRSLRDPLTRLYHTRRLDECEYAAGRQMQALMEAAVGSPAPGAPKQRIDCARVDAVPVRQIRAMRELDRLWPLLGKEGAALVTAVLGDGLLPERYAATLGRTGRDDVRATGRMFKWQLAMLARHFGLATAAVA